MEIAQIPPSPELLELLSDCDLPVADIAVSDTLRFYGCRSDGLLTGVVGLESHGSVALLRSLAVPRSSRGAGIGRALVRFVEQRARSRGVRTMFLLTETADGFFALLGYQPIPREQAPPAIAATTQFSVLCPASSRLLSKPL